MIPGILPLASFPTDFHSEYQWRELLEPSKAFVLDDAPKAYRPVVQVIDDYHRNRKLAALLETRVGPGRLLACGLNLGDAGANRPVARQMLGGPCTSAPTDAAALRTAAGSRPASCAMRSSSSSVTPFCDAEPPLAADSSAARDKMAAASSSL